MTTCAVLNRVKVKIGNAIIISRAAGAVGNAAGQLAKLGRCKVLGSSGSMDQLKFLRDECGFDIAFDYTPEPLVD